MINLKGSGMAASASVKQNLLKIFGVGWAVSVLFLFIMALPGWAVVAPLAIVEIAPLAAILGYLLSGLALFGIAMIFMWFANMLSRIGCGLEIILMLGLLPFSVKAHALLKVTFLFTFTIHWLWLVIFSFVYVSLMLYIIQRYAKINLSVGFMSTESEEAESTEE